MAQKNLLQLRLPICLQVLPLRPLLIMDLNRVTGKGCQLCGEFLKTLPSGLRPILLGIRRLPILEMPQPESLTVRQIPMARQVFFSIQSNMSSPEGRIPYRHGRRGFTAQAAITYQLYGLMRLATCYLKMTRLIFPLERMTGSREHLPQERLLRPWLWKSTSTRKATPEQSGSTMFPFFTRPSTNKLVAVVKKIVTSCVFRKCRASENS